MGRLFTGDFSAGDFTQYTEERVLNVLADKAALSWPKTGYYPLQLISDTGIGYEGGYCARFEVRDGDVPAGITTGERSHLQCATITTSVGSTQWCAFSMRFHSTWPDNHAELGWGHLMGWKDAPSGNANSSFCFGWSQASDDSRFAEDGYWWAQHFQQSAPGLGVEGVPAAPLVKFPLNRGEWHDIKIEQKFMQDDTGYVRLWHNNIRQTFLSVSSPRSLTDNDQTLNCQTLSPNGEGYTITGAFPVFGVYREINSIPTEILDVKDFRIADSEAGI